MTTDKIKYYLGDQLTSFIASLTKDQLLKMKGELIEDIRDFRLIGTEYHFKGMIELKYINSRLA